MMTRSATAKALAGPKTLHPAALRKLGVKVPEVPEVTVSPAVVPKYTPFSPPVWEHDDYSPTSPAKGTCVDDYYSPTTPCPAPLKCNFGSREHIQWIIDTTK